MPKFDRGIIKWAPFNSVINSSLVLKDVENAKQKIEMPSLSDEQLEKIEHQLIEALYEHMPITIIYFSNGKILEINSLIKKIDFIYHKIYLYSKIILFEQIVKIV